MSDEGLELVVNGVGEEGGALINKNQKDCKTLNSSYAAKILRIEQEMQNIKSFNEKTVSKLSEEMSEMRSLLNNSTPPSTPRTFPPSPQSGHSFEDDSSTNNRFFLNNSFDIRQYKLDEDTSTLMMRSKLCSFTWILSLFVFLFQVLLVSVILFDQFFESNFALLFEGSISLNLPYYVSVPIYVGQLLAILAALLFQKDLFEAIKATVVLFDQDEVTVARILQEEQTKPITKAIKMQRILLPYLCKFISGALVLVSSFVIVIRSESIIDLFKDFAAIQVISLIDNAIFMLAKNGYIGEILAKEAKNATMTEVEDKHKSVFGGCLPLHSLITTTVALFMLSIWLFIVIRQTNGVFFREKYPLCEISKYNDFSRIGDGHCDGGIFNTVQCGLDNGDCINFNIRFPSCKVQEPELIGDGSCQQEYNNQICGFDGGDCCPYTDDEPLLGDGTCHGGWYNTKQCNYDNGDCNDFNNKYPDCYIDTFELNANDHPVVIGDGICDGRYYNTATCGYEGNDCDTCRKNVMNYNFIGDGLCNGGDYNSPICSYDGGDCTSCNGLVKNITRIGDGVCDGGLYNTKECNFDGGDCIVCNRVVEDYTKIGNGICDGGAYNTRDCSSDGGDCIACNKKVNKLDGLNKRRVGDGDCNPSILEIKECNFDGGDCNVECIVEDNGRLGDGQCDGGAYNSEACNFDEGDCKKCNKFLQNLDGFSITNIGDGVCDPAISDYRLCNFDGGDCSNLCKSQIYEFGRDADNQFDRVGNKVCDGGAYNTEACRYDGGDCNKCNKIVRTLDGTSISNIGDGVCDESIMQFKDCNLDGGDCTCDSFGRVGDGKCDGGMYNSETCNYDEGDCADCNALVESLDGIDVSNIGDGVCHGAILQLGPCNFDGGDCLECADMVDEYGKIGNGVCDGGVYNKLACNFDGGDCIECNNEIKKLDDVKKKDIGNGSCDRSISNIEECDFDGGDCDEI